MPKHTTAADLVARVIAARGYPRYSPDVQTAEPTAVYDLDDREVPVCSRAFQRWLTRFAWTVLAVTSPTVVRQAQFTLEALAEE